MEHQDLNMETPKKGIAKTAAGTKPIINLKIAVQCQEVIISLIFMGAINKFVKFPAPDFFQKHHIITYACSK